MQWCKTFKAMLSLSLVTVATATAADVTPPFATAMFSEVAGADGVPLNVVEQGDASRPTILFIHGYRQSYLSWVEQFGSDLARSCHLVAFDLRGHGNSGSPWQAEAYDHSAPWAGDVAAILRARHITSPLIVAWSYGGNVAMDFAREYPQIPVAGYVLVSSPAGMLPLPAPRPDAPPRPTTSPNLQTNIKAVDGSVDLLFPPSLDPMLRAQFAAAAMRVSPFVDRAVARRAASLNTDLVDKITAPVTLVFGGRDPIVNAATAQQVQAIFHGARVITFPAAGHAPFIEEPQRFNALLASHCSTDAGSATK